MCARITVLGTCHDVQGAEKWKGLRLDDAQYKTVLKRLLRGCDFVFEEASGLGPTTLERWCVDRMGADHYLDVDPAVVDRPKFGIDRTGECYPIDASFQNTDFLCSEYVKPQAARERLWLRRIKKASFNKAIFVCGHLHMLSMSFRLRARGYEVEASCYIPWRAFCRRVMDGGA